MSRASLVAGVVAIVIGGCSDPKLRGQLAALEQRLAAAEKQNEAFAATLRQYDARIQRLQIDVLSATTDKALVSTTEPGYGIVKSNLVPFTVSVKKAVPYLAGFKVTLLIGNPSAADFDGATLKVQWWRSSSAIAAQASTGTPANDGPQLMEKEIKINKQLKAASFNMVDIVLSPVAAEDINALWIGIHTDNILLRRN